ncbi:MAG: type II secretion system protein N [Desulfuromusa sp.]|nr:type II secretion system protein N [Desulfuromusa sp.]
MLPFYQKYYVHINLLLLTLLGLACGVLGGAWLDSNMTWEGNNYSHTAPQKLEKVKIVTAADLNQILQRNLFDPSGRSNSATVDLGRDEDLSSNGLATGTGKKTASNRILLGTVAAGKKSLALMQSDGQFTIYRLDQKLPDGGTIEAIFRNHIQVRERDKSLTDVIIGEDDEVATTLPSTGKSSEGTGIKQIDERRWIVPQRTAEETRQKLPAELRLAQMQPRITNGKTDGFIIRRLKRASILNKLGLKRGDVILNINDIALDGPESGLQVFQQLREARQISLAVERKGEAMTFTYELN